jgi:hypothetical protein
MNLDHEIKIMQAFIDPRKRERYIEFLHPKKRKKKLLEKLYHFADFDSKCIVELSGSTNSADGLFAELRKRGAGDECYVISAVKEFDGITAPLDDAIKKVFACIEGTIIYCFPKNLGYYEGEAPSNRFILHRRPNE